MGVGSHLYKNHTAEEKNQVLFLARQGYAMCISENWVDRNTNSLPTLTYVFHLFALKSALTSEKTESMCIANYSIPFYVNK